MNFFDATILGLVEGLTEFLPISSTGHMILASTFLKLPDQEFLKTFEISIQLGAIMAIVFLYARKFISNLEMYKKLIVAFMPTALIGFAFYKIIKTYLFSPLVVAIALIIGGIVLIILDKKIISANSKYNNLEQITYKNAFMIGLIQCISMIPGISRAAATILGGVYNGFNKKQATEFSFLLAVPTMFAATGYDLLKTPITITSHELQVFAVGFIVAFLSAWLAVKLFLKFIEKYGFKYFGYYRIVLGVIFLWFFLA